ncbi:MAG: cyclic nucleotide-binding domain-containing protein [Pseudomonadales bacterium]|jgi:CRP-like cAMP-binding protein|nr:cyclic nucleotide-binding domain-containing protein [Pseudomonadales bacterium]
MSGIGRRPSQANPKLSEVVIAAGTILFNEGDRADAMYIIQSGEIDIAINKGADVLATLDKGSSFGEQAVVGTKYRMATATAKSDAVCLEIPADWLGRQINSAAPLLKNVFSALTLQLLQRNYIAALANSGESSGAFTIDPGGASENAWATFSRGSSLNSVYFSDGGAIQKHILAGRAIIVSSGKLELRRGSVKCSLGEGAVIGLAEVLADVELGDGVDVVSSVNAWSIDGDAAYAIVSKLNRGVFGVVKGFVGRVLGEGKSLGRMAQQPS